MNFHSRLELGRVDLQSMEPMDEYNRPFRFKKPETLEYLDTKSKITLEDFNIRSANCLKTFKFGLGTLKESSVSRLVQKVEGLSEFSLHNLIKERLFIQNEIMNKIYSRLNIHFKKTIIQDKTVSRDYWIPYIVFTMIFGYLYGQTRKLEFLEIFPKYSGLIYRLISDSSFKILNSTLRKRYWFYYTTRGRFNGRYQVHNVWSRLGVGQTITPYLPFMQRKKFQILFCNYQANELNDRTYFTQMQRNKVLINLLKSSINLSQLREDGLIKSAFFLHDRFSKDAKSNLSMFEDLIDDIEDIVFMKQAKNKEGLKIKNHLKQFQNYGESCDFLEQSLNSSMRFHCLDPMRLDIASIVNYFGEKIGLMFEFIMFYGSRKYWIIFVTTTFYVVANFTPLRDMDILKYFVFLMMLIINVYSLNFYERWNQQENLFAMQYGQTNHEPEEEPRINFSGHYRRNLATNEMNEQVVDLRAVFWRRFLVYSINTLLLAVSIATSFGVSSLKNFLTEFYQNVTGDQVSDSSVQFSTGALVMKYGLVVLNAIIVELLNILYDLIYVRMTDFENYSNLNAYESSLLIKRFSFKLFNMFNSMIIIALFKGAFPFQFGTCTNFGSTKKGVTKCYIELAVQGRLTSAHFLHHVHLFRVPARNHPHHPLQNRKQAQKVADQRKLLVFSNRSQTALSGAQAALRSHQPNRRDAPRHHEVHHR